MNNNKINCYNSLYKYCADAQIRENRSYGGLYEGDKEIISKPDDWFLKLPASMGVFTSWT